MFAFIKMQNELSNDDLRVSIDQFSLTLKMSYKIDVQPANCLCASQNESLWCK